MAESTIAQVGCRCACSHEDPYEGTETRRCCSPQVFTSVLLGLLACVLMTGGVFLAFHRWDLLWLIVSGIGIVLIIIGSILHCCHSRDQRSVGRQVPSGKGCCGRQALDHMTGHLIANNGSLTEQLLPLSNARSVSQLSLNMLPGYFPPVVATYGIEQHSAVVQNINRIIQQQQQQNPASNNSAALSGNSAVGKSFILLSLPGDQPPTNIQNVVATMYQLDDGSCTTESQATTEGTASEPHTQATMPASTTPVTYKSVEVQTCTPWLPIEPHSSSSTEATCSTRISVCSMENIQNSSVVLNELTANSEGGLHQDVSSVTETVHLINCSTESVQNCDTLNGADEETSCVIPNNFSNSILVDVSEETTLSSVPEILSEVAQAPVFSSSIVEINVQSNVSVDNAQTQENGSSNVLVDLSETDQIPEEILILDNLLNNSIPDLHFEEVVSGDIDSERFTNEQTSELSDMLPRVVHLATDNSSSLSVIEDSEDGDSVGRSSPPPCYEDVALESESSTSGALNLPYGTI